MVHVARPPIRRALSWLGVFTIAAIVALTLFVVAVASAGPTPAKPNPALKARADAAASTYALVEANFSAGIANAEAVYLWSQRLADAQRALGIASAGADHLQRMKTLELKVAKAAAAGLVSTADAKAVAYYRADAEVAP